MAAAVEHGTRAPAGCKGEITVWAWGGAIADVRDEDTAFTGRDGRVLGRRRGRLGRPGDRRRLAATWGRAFVADIAPFAQGGRYVNDVAEPGEDPAAIYGAAKQQRLAELKRAWDPDNAFRLNQNIRA